jgi:hypothetical protein
MIKTNMPQKNLTEIMIEKQLKTTDASEIDIKLLSDTLKQMENDLNKNFNEIILNIQHMKKDIMEMQQHVKGSL